MYLKLIKQILLSPLLWSIHFLSASFQRDKYKIAFGTHTKYPAGNILAHYFDVKKNLSDRYVINWIVHERKLLNWYYQQNFPVLYKYSFKGILFCLQAKFYCFSQHVNDISFAFSKNAYKINLWHGTPIKKIERDILTGRYAIRYRHPIIFNIIQPWIFDKFDLIFCSCEHDCKVFESAFGITNDHFYKTLSPRLSILKNINYKKNHDVLIIPTFRDSGVYDFSAIFDVEKLQQLAEECSINFKIKLHPADKSIINIPHDTTRVSLIDKDVNFYDILKNARIVITDYSSVFFDALSLDFPVIFYWPDIEDYKKNSREFYINVEEYFPESISYSHGELESLVRKKLSEPAMSNNKLFISFKQRDNYPIEIYKQ